MAGSLLTGKIARYRKNMEKQADPPPPTERVLSPDLGANGSETLTKMPPRCRLSDSIPSPVHVSSTACGSVECTMKGSTPPNRSTRAWAGEASQLPCYCPIKRGPSIHTSEIGPVAYDSSPCSVPAPVTNMGTGHEGESRLRLSCTYDKSPENKSRPVSSCVMKTTHKGLNLPAVTSPVASCLPSTSIIGRETAPRDQAFMHVLPHPRVECCEDAARSQAPSSLSCSSAKSYFREDEMELGLLFSSPSAVADALLMTLEEDVVADLDDLEDNSWGGVQDEAEAQARGSLGSGGSSWGGLEDELSSQRGSPLRSSVSTAPNGSTGSANSPLQEGWKQVFDEREGEDMEGNKEWVEVEEMEEVEEGDRRTPESRRNKKVKEREREGGGEESGDEGEIGRKSGGSRQDKFVDFGCEARIGGVAEALAQEAQPDCPLAATAEERVHCLLVDRRSNLPPSATAKAFEIIVPELPSPVAFSTAGAPLARPSALDVTTRPLPLRRSVLPSPESLLLHPIGDSRGEGGVRLEEVKAGRVEARGRSAPPSEAEPSLSAVGAVPPRLGMEAERLQGSSSRFEDASFRQSEADAGLGNSSFKDAQELPSDDSSQDRDGGSLSGFKSLDSVEGLGEEELISGVYLQKGAHSRAAGASPRGAGAEDSPQGSPPRSSILAQGWGYLALILPDRLAARERREERHHSRSSSRSYPLPAVSGSSSVLSPSSVAPSPRSAFPAASRPGVFVFQPAIPTCNSFQEIADVDAEEATKFERLEALPAVGEYEAEAAEKELAPSRAPKVSTESGQGNRRGGCKQLQSQFGDRKGTSRASSTNSLLLCGYAGDEGAIPDVTDQASVTCSVPGDLSPTTPERGGIGAVSGSSVRSPAIDPEEGTSSGTFLLSTKEIVQGLKGDIEGGDARVARGRRIHHGIEEEESREGQERVYSGQRGAVSVIPIARCTGASGSGQIGVTSATNSESPRHILITPPLSLGPTSVQPPSSFEVVKQSDMSACAFTSSSITRGHTLAASPPKILLPQCAKDLTLCLNQEEGAAHALSRESSASLKDSDAVEALDHVKVERGEAKFHNFSPVQEVAWGNACATSDQRTFESSLLYGRENEARNDRMHATATPPMVDMEIIYNFNRHEHREQEGPTASRCRWDEGKVRCFELLKERQEDKREEMAPREQKKNKLREEAVEREGDIENLEEMDGDEEELKGDRSPKCHEKEGIVVNDMILEGVTGNGTRKSGVRDVSRTIASAEGTSFPMIAEKKAAALRLQRKWRMVLARREVSGVQEELEVAGKSRTTGVQRTMILTLSSSKSCLPGEHVQESNRVTSTEQRQGAIHVRQEAVMLNTVSPTAGLGIREEKHGALWTLNDIYKRIHSRRTLYAALARIHNRMNDMRLLTTALNKLLSLISRHEKKHAFAYLYLNANSARGREAADVAQKSEAMLQTHRHACAEKILSLFRRRDKMRAWAAIRKSCAFVVKVINVHDRYKMAAAFRYWRTQTSGVARVQRFLLRCLARQRLKRHQAAIFRLQTWLRKCIRRRLVLDTDVTTKWQNMAIGLSRKRQKQQHKQFNMDLTRRVSAVLTIQRVARGWGVRSAALALEAKKRFDAASLLQRDLRKLLLDAESRRCCALQEAGAGLTRKMEEFEETKAKEVLKRFVRRWHHERMPTCRTNEDIDGLNGVTNDMLRLQHSWRAERMNVTPIGALGQGLKNDPPRRPLQNGLPKMKQLRVKSTTTYTESNVDCVDVIATNDERTMAWSGYHEKTIVDNYKRSGLPAEAFQTAKEADLSNNAMVTTLAMLPIPSSSSSPQSSTRPGRLVALLRCNAGKSKEQAQALDFSTSAPTEDYGKNHGNENTNNVRCDKVHRKSSILGVSGWSRTCRTESVEDGKMDYARPLCRSKTIPTLAEKRFIPVNDQEIAINMPLVVREGKGEVVSERLQRNVLEDEEDDRPVEQLLSLSPLTEEAEDYESTTLMLQSGDCGNATSPSTREVRTRSVGCNPLALLGTFTRIKTITKACTSIHLPRTQNKQNARRADPASKAVEGPSTDRSVPLVCKSNEESAPLPLAKLSTSELPSIRCKRGERAPKKSGGMRVSRAIGAIRLVLDPHAPDPARRAEVNDESSVISSNWHHDHLSNLKKQRPESQFTSGGVQRIPTAHLDKERSGSSGAAPGKESVSTQPPARVKSEARYSYLPKQHMERYCTRKNLAHINASSCLQGQSKQFSPKKHLIGVSTRSVSLHMTAGNAKKSKQIQEPSVAKICERKHSSHVAGGTSREWRQEKNEERREKDTGGRDRTRQRRKSQEEIRRRADMSICTTPQATHFVNDNSYQMQCDRLVANAENLQRRKNACTSGPSNAFSRKIDKTSCNDSSFEHATHRPSEGNYNSSYPCKRPFPTTTLPCRIVRDSLENERDRRYRK